MKQGSKSIIFCIETLAGEASYQLSGTDPRVAADRQVHHVTGKARQNIVEVSNIDKDSPVWTDVQASKTLYLTVTNLLQAEADKHKIQLLFTAVCTDQLYAPMGAHYKMNVVGLKKLSIHTNTLQVKGNHHFKFVVEGVPRLPQSSLFVKGRKASKDKSDQPFNFVRYDNLKVGYIVD